MAAPKLTVLVDEGDTDSPAPVHHTPQREPTTLMSPYIGTPYSGSVAGSTTKQARRRTGAMGIDRMDSRSMDHFNDGEPSPSILDNTSSGKTPGAERVNSKYEKMERMGLPADSGGLDQRGDRDRERRSKKKKRGRMLLILAALVGLVLVVFSLGGFERVGTISLLGRDDGSNLSGQFYDPSLHKDEFELLVDAAGKTSFNGRRVCVSSDTHAATGAAEKVPDLIEIHAWKSRKPVEGNSISLVTHLTVDRIPALEQQCLVWPDKIVAAIYVPMTTNSSGGLPLLPGYSSTTLDDMIRGIGSFHVYMEKTAVCSMDLVFLGQFISKAEVPGSYPSNALRNKALSLVTTELSLHANVDVVLNPYLDSPSFEDRTSSSGGNYKDPEVYRELVIAANKKTAFIMPVLEVASRGQDARIVRNIARSQALAGKQSAKDFLSKRVLVPYVAPEDAEKRIWSVDLERWAASSPKDGHALVKIDKGQPAMNTVSEPCVLLATDKTPWFDERFVDNGPGVNVWTKVLEHEKFKFRVHSSGFGVHLSHERKPPKSHYLQRRRDFRMEVMQFLNSTLDQDIEKGKFKPMIQDCGKFAQVGEEDGSSLDVGIE